MSVGRKDDNGCWGKKAIWRLTSVFLPVPCFGFKLHWDSSISALKHCWFNCRVPSTDGQEKRKKHVCLCNPKCFISDPSSKFQNWRMSCLVSSGRQVSSVFESKVIESDSLHKTETRVFIIYWLKKWVMNIELITESPWLEKNVSQKSVRYTQRSV